MCVLHRTVWYSERLHHNLFVWEDALDLQPAKKLCRLKHTYSTSTLEFLGLGFFLDVILFPKAERTDTECDHDLCDFIPSTFSLVRKRNSLFFCLFVFSTDHTRSVEGGHELWPTLVCVFAPLVQFIEGQANDLGQILQSLWKLVHGRWRKTHSLPPDIVNFMFCLVTCCQFAHSLSSQWRIWGVKNKWVRLLGIHPINNL